MAKKKAEPEAPKGILASAAMTIGTAAGKIAASVGVSPANPQAKKPAVKKSAKKYRSPAIKKAKKAVKKLPAVRKRR